MEVSEHGSSGRAAANEQPASKTVRNANRRVVIVSFCRLQRDAETAFATYRASFAALRRRGSFGQEPPLECTA